MMTVTNTLVARAIQLSDSLRWIVGEETPEMEVALRMAVDLNRIAPQLEQIPKHLN